MSIKVTVVTVVYGNRWNLLEKVADACLIDGRVTNFVIVDNGCHDTLKMEAYAAKHNPRISILKQGENIGYSGAINKGITFAQKTNVDYVFILDDDSVPEVGAIDYFLNNLQLFPSKKTILVGNRIDVPGNENFFRTKNVYQRNNTKTLYEVFSFKKLYNFFCVLVGINSSNKTYPYIPVIPVDAFVTGGTFLPIEAVRAVEPPDASFFIYAEDLDYAWRMRAAGYEIYACARPIIRDIDMTFPNIRDHIYGLFRQTTPDYKVFFRMRNTVIISRRHSGKSKFSLGLNVFFWYVGLNIIGVVRTGPTKFFFKRSALVAKALYRGFKLDTSRPSYVAVPK